VEAAIGDAKAACSDGSTAECAAAWDVVEEISAAKSHDKAKKAVRVRASHAPRAEGTARGARHDAASSTSAAALGDSPWPAATAAWRLGTASFSA